MYKLSLLAPPAAAVQPYPGRHPGTVLCLTRAQGAPVYPKYLLAYTNLYDEEEALRAVFGSLLLVSLIALLIFS